LDNILWKPEQCNTILDKRWNIFIQIVFTDWSWLFIVALVISLAGLYASISLFKKEEMV
jgi:hypothetical protein